MENDFDVTDDDVEDVVRKARKKREQSGRIVVPVTEESHLKYVEEHIDNAFSDFSKNEDRGRPEDYQRAVRVVSGISLLQLRSSDLSSYFGRKIEKDSYKTPQLGVFFSALLNRTLRPDESVVLDATGSDPRSTYWPRNVCSYLERWTVIVKGGMAQDCAQYVKRGAKVIFEGDFWEFNGHGAGDFLEGGEIEFMGAVSCDILRSMKSGRAIIHKFLKDCHVLERGNSFGANQEGGTIDVMCDFRYNSSDDGIAVCQSGGEAIFHENVSYASVGYGKTGGRVIFKKDVKRVSLGSDMRGGEIIVEGGVVGDGEHRNSSYVSSEQSGGIIRIAKNVEGQIGAGYNRGCIGGEVYVGGNVIGDIGRHDTYGLKVFVAGDVRGKVGCITPYIFCEVSGSVYGDVGDHLGLPSFQPWAREGWKRSNIKIKGNVDGKVGEDSLNADIYVDGKIREVGYSCKGTHIYQNHKDVTRIPLLVRIFGKE